MKNIFLTILFAVVSITNIWADAVGTWTLYPCYNNVTDIVPAGNSIYVLASSNLYSYNTNDNSLQTYTKNDVLNSSDIQNIAWVKATKKLVITYSDYTIDILSQNSDVENISALANKETTDNKTINSIYVNGQYAYLSTGFGIMKINTKDATIADTYNLGFNVNYCYIDGSYLYAASESKGLMRCTLTANLLNKNEWENAGSYTPQTKDTYVKDDTNNCYWAADSDSKLTKYEKQEDGSFTAVSTGVKPDGPAYQEQNYLKYNNGRILSVRGMYEYTTEDTATPGYVQEYTISSNTWDCYDNSYATQNNKNCITQTAIEVDPRNKNHIMVAAKSGLYEYKDKKMIAYHDMNTDDPIKSVIDNVDYSVITGLKYDSSGNLWMFNMGNTNLLCLTSDGQWKSYPHSELSTESNVRIKSCYFDSRGFLWFVNDWWKPGFVGFYDTKSDQFRILKTFTNEDGTNIFTDLCAFSVTEDNNKNIWIGDEGGCCYLTSDMISAMCKSSDMSDITVTQYKVPRNDGTNNADYLLNNIFIRDIKIDAANRKWIASSSGIYVISDDCNTQIAHFTTDNSPIPTNEIKSIAIDESTGKVFFGTVKGMFSYQSDITSSYGDMTTDNVYAYPNPVTPEFVGDITIVGLTSGSQIKILTSSGQLVNEGTCSGGSYTWDGCDLNGNKVASGVYMVNVATSEGESGVVTKIGIVR